MSTREAGVIRSVTEDDEYNTVWIHVDLHSGGCQGFGGLRLSAVERAAFLQAVAETFGHAPLQLVGLKCFVLRCFPDLNARIEGLESLSGRRFTITSWACKRWPNVPRLSPLEETRHALESSKESFRRSIAHVDAALKRLDGDYVDWG